MKPAPMLPRMAALAGLCVAFAGASRAAADPGCGVGVLFAQRVAVGTAHGFGEYLIQLTPAGTVPRSPSNRSLSPMTVSLAAQDAGGSTTLLSVDDVVVTFPFVQTGKTDAILVVLSSPDVRTFSVQSVTSGGIVRTCAPLVPYDVPAAYRPSSASFDDDDSWVKIASPVALVLDGPKWTSRGTPDASSFDSKFADEADVNATLVVGADGSLKDAAIVRSSGQPSLDAASLEAIRESRFSPARLPAAFGGSPVTVETSVEYVFMSQ